MDNKTAKLFMRIYKEKEKIINEYFKQEYDLDVKRDTEKLTSYIWEALLNIWKDYNKQDLEDFELELDIAKVGHTVEDYNKVLKTNVITIDADRNYDVLYSKLSKNFLNEGIGIYINSEKNTLVINTTRKHIDKLMDIAIRKLGK